MSLYCLDCDGTLECSPTPGPVKLDWLRMLRDQGDQVVIVSDSGGCVSIWQENGGEFEHISGGATSGDSRTEALRQAGAKYPAVPRFYVSDNPGDDERSRQAGFCYIHPKDFRM